MNNIIEGMKVLEQTSIKDYTTLSGVLTGIGILITVMSIVFLIFKNRDKEKIDIKGKIFKTFLFFYVLGSGLALFSNIRFPWFYIETGKYIYECKLEDSISANYISDNFNIISVDNDVWTIEDK